MLNTYQPINTLKINRIFLVLFLLGSSYAAQAQYYWVGGSGDWTDFANHWATSSGGADFHTQVPTPDDDVYFDANSFSSSGQVVTVDENYSQCKSLDFTGVQFEPTFQGNGYDILQVYGSLTLSPDMIFNPVVIQMASSETGITVQTNGTELGGVGILRFQGSGTFELMDNVTAGNVQVPKGTFHTNGHDIFADMVILSGVDQKNVYLYDSEIHISQWRHGGENINFDSGTSTIFCSVLRLDEQGSGPYTFNKVTINNDSGVFYNSGNITTLDLSQTHGGYLRFEAGETVTVENLVGEVASRQNPLHFYSSEEGVAGNIAKNSGTLDFQYIKLQDMHTSGGATFNANECQDLGNNVGWNISDIEPIEYFWVNDGGDWGDLSHWATTSGGATMHTVVPSQFDDVYIDAASFTLGGTITIEDDYEVRNISTEGVQFNPTIAAAYADVLSVFGDMHFTDGIDRDIYGLNFQGLGDHQVWFGSDSDGTQFSFWGGGTWTFMEDVNCSSISLLDGTIDFNDFDVTCGNRVYENNYNNNTFYLGNGTITCKDFIINDEDANILPEGSIIYCSEDFQGGGHSYNIVYIEGESSITDDNTFNHLEIAPGSLCNIEASSVQTINQDLVLQGTSLEPITLISSEDGTQATFTKSSGTVDGAFLILKDNNATGGATFNADQSVDNGNNSGWNITEIVPGDFYWVGGEGDWSDFSNHWATSSGGNNFYNYAPGALDNVYFDENSFTAAGQMVIIDLESVNFHDMDWTGVTNDPILMASNETMNVYGSLILSPNMSANLNNINFFSNETETIDPGFEFSPGFNSYLYFNSGGTFNVVSDLQCREISMEAGSIIMNGNDLSVDFNTYFYGEGEKLIDFSGSNYYSRGMSWNTFESANLTLEGSNSTYSFSSSFTPLNFDESDESIVLNLNNVDIINGNDTDEANLNSSFSCNELSIVEGKTVNIYFNSVITVNQLIAQGSLGEEITIQGSNEGTQGIIYQESGTVVGEYLRLMDTGAQGGAEFYANNSENLGNVSGWIFTGTPQTITFNQIDDVMEDVGSFELTATSSSGLQVEYSILAGNATIDGTTITITGAGPVIVEANQDGDVEFNPAASVTVEFCSIPLQPAITTDILGESAILTSSSEFNNQWFESGSPIPGAINQEYETFQNGTYTVQVDADGCVSEMSADVVIIDLSLTDLNGFELEMYPNPVLDAAMITGIPQGNYVVIVYDQAGKVVFNDLMNFSTSGTSIELSTLQAGVYIIAVSADDFQSKIRFVKQ